MSVSSSRAASSSDSSSRHSTRSSAPSAPPPPAADGLPRSTTGAVREDRAPYPRRAPRHCGHERGRRLESSALLRRGRASSAAGAHAVPPARRPRRGFERRAPARARGARSGSRPWRARRERSMARLRGRAEEVRELPEGEPLAPSLEEPSGEPDGVDDRGREAAPGEALDLTLEEADVEASVVRDEGASPANARKRRTASSAWGARRRSLGWIPVSAAMLAGSTTPGLTSVSNVSSTASARTRTAPISHMRSRLAESPVVSRSKTTSSASSMRTSALASSARPTRAPSQARRASPSTTSASRLCASVAGARSRANRTRAASSAETAPLRA